MDGSRQRLSRPGDVEISCVRPLTPIRRCGPNWPGLQEARMGDRRIVAASMLALVSATVVAGSALASEADKALHACARRDPETAAAVSALDGCLGLKMTSLAQPGQAAPDL